jgi:hypothetical protein
MKMAKLELKGGDYTNALFIFKIGLVSPLGGLI